MSVSVVRSKFGELFSSKKKIAGFAVTFVLVLAIPLTVTLVSRQQDIRQRASETTGLDGYTVATALPANSTIQFNLTDGDTKWVGWVANGKLYKMKQITPGTETRDTDYYWETTTPPPAETQTKTIVDNGTTWLTWLSTADNRSYKMKQITPGTETAGADGYYETTTPPTGMVVHTVVDGGTVWYVWTDNGTLYKMRVGGTPSDTPSLTPVQETPTPTPVQTCPAQGSSSVQFCNSNSLVHQYADGNCGTTQTNTVCPNGCEMRNGSGFCSAAPTATPTPAIGTTGSCLERFSTYCHIEMNGGNINCDFRNHCDQAIRWSECNTPSQDPAFIYNFCLRASTQ